jgi:hypothetical protein
MLRTLQDSAQAYQCLATRCHVAKIRVEIFPTALAAERQMFLFYHIPCSEKAAQ